MIYSVSTFILLFIISVIIVIVSKININYTNIFRSLWMYDTEMNIYITYILNEYIKNRNINFDDYITADEKLVKIDLYRMFIIAVDILNGLDIIILVDIAYCFTFLTNITSVKRFQLKKVYLDKKHNQLHKKKII